MSSKCHHFEEVDNEKFRNYNGCIECVKNSDTWVNLRTCMECGGTRCCDSSPNQHASKHWEKSKHRVMLMVDNGLMWCFEHEDVNK